MKSEPNITTNIDLSFLSIKKQRIIYAHVHKGTRYEDGSRGPNIHSTVPYLNGKRLYRVMEIDVIKSTVIQVVGYKRTRTLTGVYEVREKE